MRCRACAQEDKVGPGAEAVVKKEEEEDDEDTGKVGVQPGGDHIGA